MQEKNKKNIFLEEKKNIMGKYIYFDLYHIL